MTNTIIPHDDHHQPWLLQQEREQQAPAVKPPPPQMTKKQARRKTHTSRPYQERLLNMAEARREIVTALKIHRANMMRQGRPTYQPPRPPPPLHQSPMQLRRYDQQQQQPIQLVFQYQDQNQAVGEESPMAPMSYAADPLAHWIAAAAAPARSHYCSTSPVLPYDLKPFEVTTPAMGGLEQLARSLPEQPLGLNLSFQGFGGSVDGGAVGCDQDLFGVPLIQPSSLLSPAASSYSPPATEMESGTHGSPALISTAEEYSPAAAAALFPVLDNDGEKQSAGEAQSVVEWGEATAAADVTTASAWWSKILLESMESGGEVADGVAVEDVAATATLPVEWPWLCDDQQGAVVKGAAEPPDVLLETMLADGNYYTCCYSDEGDRASDSITLPCMDDMLLKSGTGSSGSHAHQCMMITTPDRSVASHFL